MTLHFFPDSNSKNNNPIVDWLHIGQIAKIYKLASNVFCNIYNEQLKIIDSLIYWFIDLHFLKLFNIKLSFLIGYWETVSNQIFKFLKIPFLV